MHVRYFSIKLVFLLLPVLAGTLNAQTSAVSKPATANDKVYKVGDKVPDLIFRNLINHNASQISLNELKGKLVIIDFWEQGCSLCMEIFPKVQELQKKYADKLQVVTVTKLHNKKDFEKGMNMFPALKKFNLPTVIEDDQLYKNFPFGSISHIVWIDGDGIVKAITTSDYITDKNVQLALKGGDLPWPVKQDVPDFEAEKPLVSFAHTTVPTPTTLFYSAFTGYIPGIDPFDQEIIDSANNRLTIIRYNKTIAAFCDASLDGMSAGHIRPKFLKVIGKDIGRYIYDFSKEEYLHEWFKKNAYCYTVTVPLSMPMQERKAFMRNDITHWLGLLGIASVKKEEREMPCYAIVQTGNGKKFPVAKGLEEKTRFAYPYDSTILKNVELSSLLTSINDYLTELPHLIVNRTGFPDDVKIDMSFSENFLKSIGQFKKELNQYGLDLVPSTFKTKVHVITEKGYEGKAKP